MKLKLRATPDYHDKRRKLTLSLALLHHDALPNHFSTLIYFILVYFLINLTEHD